MYQEKKGFNLQTQLYHENDSVMEQLSGIINAYEGVYFHLLLP